MSLNNIFNPKSIVIIGASDETGSVGYDLFANIYKSEYGGKFFAVNNKRKKIQGQKAYNNVLEIKEEIDLAIIVVPAQFVPSVLEDCGKQGIRGVLIISAGFQEIGESGLKLVKEIKKISQKYKIRIIGPNCLGFLCPRINLNASFASKNAKDGNVAFISQSGALCTSVLDWALKENIGFSYFVSIGAMLDVSFDEIIQYLAEDKNTKVICIYMESLTRSREFLKIVRKTIKKKPIVILKVGVTKAGSNAAKSHTGSLTGDDRVFQTVFDELGVIRVKDIRELFSAIKIFSFFKKTKNNNLAILTNAGGPGVIASDAMSSFQIKNIQVSKDTIKKLNQILPPAWSHTNPFDILGDACEQRYKESLEIILEDKNINNVLLILTPQSMTNPTEVARNMLEISQKYFLKNIFSSFIGGNSLNEGIKILQENNIINFETPSEAIQAFSLFDQYYKKENKNNFLKNKQVLKFDKNPVQKIITQAREEKRKSLNELEAKKILACYNILSPKSFVVKNKTEAGFYFKKIKGKVAMKIVSSDILHKFDLGGVVLGVNSFWEAGKTFSKIINSVQEKNPQAKIQGVLIEELVDVRYEVLLGVKKDDIFGHVLVFGAGGTYVELINDVSLALIDNFDRKKAFDLISRTKIFKMLNAYRGGYQVNIEKLIDVIMNFFCLIKDFPEIKEADLNPLVINEKGIFCLDAKIIFEKK